MSTIVVCRRCARGWGMSDLLPAGSVPSDFGSFLRIELVELCGAAEAFLPNDLRPERVRQIDIGTF